MSDTQTLFDLHHMEEVASSHPLLRGLLRDLPVAHSTWSKEEQHQWLALAASIFAVLYEESSEASQEIQRRKGSP